jgi:hypothetical protein
MEQTNTSILSRFPEYGFKSTSVYNKRAVGRKWLFFLYTILVVFGGYAIIGGFELYRLQMGYNIFWLHMLSVFLLTGGLINWYIRGNLNSSFSDYIQTKGKMRFFVKDGKFGLVKWSNFKIFIPAMYDKLMWVQENEVMKAYVNGEEFLIDIHNNKLS